MVKQVVCILLAVTLLCILSPLVALPVHAQTTAESDGWTPDVGKKPTKPEEPKEPEINTPIFTCQVSGGEITVTGYTGNGGNVVIPSTLKGYPVTSIGKNAFSDCIGLTSITLPDSVLSIGDAAFGYCYNLTDVWYTGNEINKSVLFIGNNNDLLTSATWHYDACPIGTEHTYDNTCDAECNVCKQTRNNTHDYEWVTDKAETCGVDGQKHEECTLCHTTRNENTVIPATTKHDYAAATCKTPKTCEVCGATTGSKLSHKSDTGTVTKKATCTNTGTKTYTCTLCKAVIKTETIAKVAHKYDTGKVTAKATCKDTGVKTYTCSGCNGIKTETIAKSSTHTYTKVTTVKATLSKNGYVLTECKTCGKDKSKVTTYYAKSFTLSTTSYTYNGKAKTPSVVVKDAKSNTLKKDTDYTVSYASGRTNVGTYKVTVTMKGKYSGSTVLTFKINPASISLYKLSTATYTYNGKAKTPSVTVKNASGATLTKNTHYTVTYANGRTNVGTYKVTIKGKGNYTGSKTLTFKISPAGLSSYKLSTTAYTYNGKAKTPSVTVKNASGTTLKKDTHYTVTYASGRKNVGTYKVTIKGKGNYTGTKTLYFTIKPKAASINTLTAKSKALTVKLNRSLQQSTGYQIQYSTSKSFKSYKIKTITSYKTSITTLTGLKAKTTYYVRVRTYKTVNGTKHYSNWSTYKYIKTK